MSKSWSLLALLVLLAACRKEETLPPLSDAESAAVQARAYSFKVYPGSRFLQPQTELFRKAHFVLHPDAVQAPPTAAYESDASVADVAKFYAEDSGFGRVADSEANGFSSVKPAAYMTKGELAADLPSIKPILEKLSMQVDDSKAVGAYVGAHVNGTHTRPRITIQRPYFDVATSRVIDKTLIIMVRE